MQGKCSDFAKIDYKFMVMCGLYDNKIFVQFFKIIQTSHCIKEVR
jgi:hypothetical protein